MFILPVTRDTPVRHTAWAIYSLILANSLVFLATGWPPNAEGVAHRFGFSPANHEPVTVLTSLFLHADLLHILGNMFFLWMFGESIENALGHVLTLAGYLICGAAGAVLHYLVNPHSTMPCIGASGAISGMVGMYMVLFPDAKMELVFYLSWIRLGAVRTSALVAIVIWLVEQSLLWLVAALIGRSFGIAFMAHVGGLVAGAALGLAVTLSGIAPGYRRMVGRKAARRLYCPACGAELPWLSPGHHNCWPCGATFRVDEQGEIAISDPAKPSAPRWLMLTLLVFVYVGIFLMYFSAWRCWR